MPTESSNVGYWGQRLSISRLSFEYLHLTLKAVLRSINFLAPDLWMQSRGIDDRVVLDMHQQDPAKH